MQVACGLQYYHWQIAVDLAFFSSITHLTTLTCLHSFFHTHHALRTWRLACMSVATVLLAVALGTTGFSDVEPSRPALCLLKGREDSLADDISSYGSPASYDVLYTTMILVFLVVSYGTRVVQLFPLSQKTASRLLRDPPKAFFTRWLNSSQRRTEASSTKFASSFWSVVHKSLLSIFCLGKAAFDLYGSLLWEVCIRSFLFITSSTPNCPFR